MIKYSIIVPVYNTAEYLEKCLDSILNQTYNNYEIIIVNDGSKDRSKKIIAEYENEHENIKVITQKNEGLSEARNVGVRKATGEYIIFLDSDDFIEPNLLETLNDYNDDVIRFQVTVYNENYQKVKEFPEQEFKSLSGEDAFLVISGYHFVEVACAYAYRKAFWNKHKFLFMKDKIHEDFGLIPLVIFTAESISSINKYLYNYLIRFNSITNSNDYKKEKQKAFDMIDHYFFVKEVLKRKDYQNKDTSVLLSYIANSVIIKAKKLNEEDMNVYIDQIKKLKVIENVKADTIIRKLKKLLMYINLKWYLKVGK